MISLQHSETGERPPPGGHRNRRGGYSSAHHLALQKNNTKIRHTFREQSSYALGNSGFWRDRFAKDDKDADKPPPYPTA